MPEKEEPKTLEALLEELAIELPKSLLARIKDGEATGQDLSVARQLLKDNGIMSIPGANKGLDELEAKLGDVDLPDPLKFVGEEAG